MAEAESNNELYSLDSEGVILHLADTTDWDLIGVARTAP